MTKALRISKQATVRGTVRHLTSSKSISNRTLILDALAGGSSTIENLSEANDTVLMQRLLKDQSPILDVEDAGTTMRFLTAYCAVRGLEKTITGTDRMKQRPIGILVDALRNIGADIQYVEKEGYPPVQTGAFKGQTASSIEMRGDVSSQYISALMMVGPSLPSGLFVNLLGKVVSRPYIEMTASLMRRFGAELELDDQSVQIPPRAYQPAKVVIESDWSSASYWFAFAALAEEAEILIPNMTIKSIQGDAAILDIMEALGVRAEPRGSGLLLQKKDHRDEFEWDFTHCPDLAQTVAVVCTVKGVRAKFTGLESLRIKETDRIKALHDELFKIGGSLVESGNSWILTTINPLPTEATIETYLDHRMAMAFAPLGACMTVTITDPAVTRKSYPGYWNDVRNFGFDVTEL